MLLPSTTSPRRELVGQFVRFVLVGGVTTGVYLVLYALLEGSLGRQAANALALLLTADANSMAHRRLTFGAAAGQHGRAGRLRGSLTYVVSFLFTSATLAVLEGLGARDGSVYLVGLAVANAVSGVLHFVLLRSWAFPAVPAPVLRSYAEGLPVPRRRLCPRG
jgi:putative flippase GtrA